MSCIKTGAIVFVRNYGYTVRADLYKVDNVFIVRWNTQSIEYGTTDKDANLVIDYIENSECWFHREDLGITVVPDYLAHWYF